MRCKFCKGRGCRHCDCKLCDCGVCSCCNGKCQCGEVRCFNALEEVFEEAIVKGVVVVSLCVGSTVERYLAERSAHYARLRGKPAPFNALWYRDVEVQATEATPDAVVARLSNGEVLRHRADS